MEFIRNNLYYVVLTGIVVVVGAIVVVVGAGAGGTVDEQLQVRQGIDASLARLARQEPVTVGVVDAEEGRVKKIREQKKVVEAGTIKWNKGDYPMFQATQRDGQPFPAFREDPKIEGKFTREKYAEWKKAEEGLQKELYYQHTADYLEVLDKLLREQWRMTTTPTGDAMYGEKLLRERRLKAEADARKKQEEMRAREEMRKAAAAEKSGQPARVAAEDRKVVHQMAGVLESPEAMAEKQAREKLSIDYSERGWIYATRDETNPIAGFEPVLQPGGRMRLYQAWVHTRVVRDVAVAFRQTVEDVLKRDPANKGVANVLEKATVAQSPIKQLLGIRLHSEGLPYTGGQAVYTRGGHAGILAPAAAGGAAGKAAAPTLTGRATNQQFDVIRYAVDVVMDERYLGDLQRNLYRQNDHCVLNIQVEHVSPTAGARGGAGAFAEGRGEIGSGAPGGAAKIDMSLCYYGTDPVAYVTIEGELLMRADWTRALMPEEMLAEIRRSLPSAMRTEDMTRLTLYGTVRSRPGMAP